MEKTFTYQELQQYNGKNGNPAYIAYKGTVYDVTGSDLWKDGRHQNIAGGNIFYTSVNMTGSTVESRQNKAINYAHKYKGQGTKG